MSSAITNRLYASGSNLDNMLGVDKIHATVRSKDTTRPTLEQRKNLLDSKDDEDDNSESEENLVEQDGLFLGDEDDLVSGFGLGSSVREFTESEALPYISRFLESGDYIEDIKLCYASTFLITKFKRVFMIGNNFLKMGSSRSLIAPKEVTWSGCRNENKLMDISCGHFHVVILTENKEVLVGGNNNYGQLGQTMADSIFSQDNGYSSNSEDDNEPIVDIVKPHLQENTLQTLRFFYTELKGDYVERVACGSFFTVFLTKLKKVYICGQIGFEDQKVFKTPVRIKFFDSMQAVERIMCGSDYIIFLTREKQVYGFSLLDPETTQQQPSHMSEVEFFLSQHPGSTVECGLGYTFFLTPDRKLFCTGSNCEGELGIDKTVENVEKIIRNTTIDQEIGAKDAICSVSCGSAVSAVVTLNGYVFLMGDNLEGQLGIGVTFTTSKKPIQPKGLPQFKGKVKVFVGYHNVFVLETPQ